jgi:hypothetical protein
MLAAVLHPVGCALCSQIAEWLVGNADNLSGMMLDLDCKNEKRLSSVRLFSKFVKIHNWLKG